MSKRTASACGKIILTGEYAVVFGKRGIAVPSKESVTVTWTDNASFSEPMIVWKEVRKEWADYARQIVEYLKPFTGDLRGTLTIKCDIPLGKGMGSSTALVIAISRCLLGQECEQAARSVEDKINPDHSGIDFAVIWANAPILFSQGREPTMIDLPKDILKDAELIDTGQPNEATRELVAWIKNIYPAAKTLRLGTEGAKIYESIEVIGNCTERLLKGESLCTVMRDHHRAQVMLGVVPEKAQKIISEIEAKGGSAKVIGAGGRTGGGGMVLNLQVH